MSGIAGFTKFSNKTNLANKANEIQSHRGPDKAEIWEDAYVSLAQQYLHITKDEIPEQVILKKNDLVLIFDGELYNSPAIKEKLRSLNVFSEYNSTSELLLAYYEACGADMLPFLNGTFAIAIYNTKTKKIFLARDHFGVKPLFYTGNDFGFAFSSELKALTIIPGFDKTINAKALVSALNYVWVSGADTMFKSVHKLLPAHYVIVEQGKAPEQVRYWDIDDKDVNGSNNETELADLIGQSFKDAVNRRLEDGVDVSCFLSGGLDSSLVSTITHENRKHLSTYTISISEKDKAVEKMPDDEYYAAYLAANKGFNHNKIEISADIIQSLPEIVKTLDEPIGDPAAINTYLICKAVKEKGINVMLAGVGSDEIFMGHRAGKATLWSQDYFNKLPSLLQKLIVSVGNRVPVMIGKKGFRFGRWTKRFLSFVSLPLDEAYMRSYSYYSPEQLTNLVTDEFKPGVQQIVDEHKTIFESKYKNDPINQICYTDINMFMVGLNLTYTDRASMAASVVIRMPFVDREFIKESMRLQGKFKLRHRISKYILKVAAKKFLPSKIITRPKAAFSAPIRSWISNDLRSMVDELLSEKSITDRGILNYEIVKKMIENDRKGLEDNAYHIYQFLTLELWCREFIDKAHVLSESGSVKLKAA